MMGMVTGKDERCLKLAKIVEPIIDDEGYHLVRIRLFKTGKGLNVQIMIERQDDQLITVEDCSRLSRAISVTLDVEDPLSETYALEISSPGLDRPLTRKNDFQRFSGDYAKIELIKAQQGRKRFHGILRGLEGEDIMLKTDQGICALPFAQVISACLRYRDDRDDRDDREEQKTGYDAPFIEASDPH